VSELRHDLAAALEETRSRAEAAAQAAGARADGMRSEVLEALAADRDTFEQAIEELQAVVETRCITKELLGQVFAARDDMRQAWHRMQALFEASSNAETLFVRRVRRTSSVSRRSTAETVAVMAQQSVGAEAPTAAEQLAASQPEAGEALQKQAAAPEQAIETGGSDDPFACLASSRIVTASSTAASIGAAPVDVAAQSQLSQQAGVDRLSSGAASAPLTPPGPPAASKAELSAVVAFHASMRQELAELSDQVGACDEGQWRSDGVLSCSSLVRKVSTQ